MNYIYDVILNFQKNYYDFYEWNKNDDIYHIRKIPILKISKKDFIEIKNNNIVFDKTSINFLENPKIQAEKFNQTGITKIKRTIIIACENMAMAIKINKNGQIEYKSSLLPEENEDAIEIIKFQKETNLKYKIIKNNKPNTFQTRFELEHAYFINQELDKIYKEKNQKKLSFLYLECFNKNENNIDLTYKNLKKSITKSSDTLKKLYDIFIITKQKG